MNNKVSRLAQDQSGALAVWAALVVVVLAGMAALVIDIGRLAVVKSELQKAADAGALAGARALCTGPPYPNWTSAQNLARATAQENKADGSLITTCQVQVGYWDFSWQATTAPATLKPTGTVPTSQDVPAVKVTITKNTQDSVQNNGPLSMLFGSVFGIKPIAVSAKAVACAVSLPANQISPGLAFPMATPKSFVNQLWGHNPPQSFRIGSSYQDPTGGQWTSFLSNANDVPTVRELIDSGNPTPLKVGDQIWIEPGTKTTLYDEAANRIGETVLVTIVSDNFDSSTQTPILAFVPFYIEDAQGGSDKYIQGHFVNSYTVPGGIGAPGTPNYGAMAGSPKLID
jgi:Flp pilus assembly protein TadG